VVRTSVGVGLVDEAGPSCLVLEVDARELEVADGPLGGRHDMEARDPGDAVEASVEDDLPFPNAHPPGAWVHAERASDSARLFRGFALIVHAFGSVGEGRGSYFFSAAGTGMRSTPT